VLDDQMAEYLTYCDHQGLAPGSQGWWDDARAHLRPWGSSWRPISPSPCWCCTAGRTSSFPFGHGQWLAAHIPGAEARLLDDDRVLYPERVELRAEGQVRFTAVPGDEMVSDD
jgi:hypothetical protein